MYPGIIDFNSAHIHCPFSNVLIKINCLLEFIFLIHARDEKTQCILSNHSDLIVAIMIKIEVSVLANGFCFLVSILANISSDFGQYYWINILSSISKLNMILPICIGISYLKPWLRCITKR